MISDGRNLGEERCVHRNFYRQSINSNQFYVCCGVCHERLNTVTFEVNPIPKESYTRIITRREIERRRPPSNQSLEAVGSK